MSWWQQTFKYINLVITMVDKTERNASEIKDLRRELSDMSAAMRVLIFENRHERKMAEKDRELLLLRLETRLLRHERGLPQLDDDL